MIPSRDDILEIAKSDPVVHASILLACKEGVTYEDALRVAVSELSSVCQRLRQELIDERSNKVFKLGVPFGGRT